MKRIITALIIAVGFLLTVGASNAVWAKNNNHSDKIICQATLDDEFSDDCVIVVIDPNHGGINKFFSKDKFKGVDLTSVEDLTEIKGDPDTKLYLDQENFKQVLKLSLVKTGKNEVLKAIRKLEKLDFVYSALPNYYFYLNESESISSDYEEERGKSETGAGDRRTEESTDSVTEVPIDEAQVVSSAQSDENEIQLLSATPNDPNYSSQWGLNAIKAPQAWEVTTGNAASTPMSQRVMVGVIDSGVADHP